MHPRWFALVTGVMYLTLGITAFVPWFSTYPPELPPLRLEVSYGMFMGLFAQNIVNKVAIIAFGIAGLLAYSARNHSEWRSIVYARTVAIVMGAAAILGLIPATSTFFGYWPLFGAEAYLHGVNALAGVYFGFQSALGKVESDSQPAPTARG